MTPTQITEAQRLADELERNFPRLLLPRKAADLLRTLAAQAAQAQQPAGKLHADGYFTWHRRDGYVLDKRLPCEFYLTPQPAREGLTDAQIEAIAVEHEDFGFGRVGARGVSTHGFSPEGLVAFARAIEAAHGIGTAGAQEATR